MFLLGDQYQFLRLHWCCPVVQGQCSEEVMKPPPAPPVAEHRSGWNPTAVSRERLLACGIPLTPAWLHLSPPEPAVSPEMDASLKNMRGVRILAWLILAPNTEGLGHKWHAFKNKALISSFVVHNQSQSFSNLNHSCCLRSTVTSLMFINLRKQLFWGALPHERRKNFYLNEDGWLNWKM